MLDNNFSTDRHHSVSFDSIIIIIIIIIIIDRMKLVIYLEECHELKCLSPGSGLIETIYWQQRC